MGKDQSSRRLTIYYYPITEDTNTQDILKYVDKYGIDVVLHQDLVINHEKYWKDGKTLPYVQIGRYHKLLNKEEYVDAIKATNDTTVTEELLTELFERNVNIVSITNLKPDSLARPDDFDWNRVGVKREFMLDFMNYESKLYEGCIGYTTKHRGIKILICLRHLQLRRIYHPKYSGTSPIISAALRRRRASLYFIKANDILAYNEEIYQDALRWARRFRRYYAHNYHYIRRSRCVYEEFFIERRQEHLEQSIEVDVEEIDKESEDGSI